MIRRLEELGIMRDVDVISAVSGGSIVAAYTLWILGHCSDNRQTGMAYRSE